MPTCLRLSAPGLFLLLVLLPAHVAAQPSNEGASEPDSLLRYHDVYVTSDGEHVLFGNDQVQLAFHASTGRWLRLKRADRTHNLLADRTGTSSLTIDVRVNDEWVGEKTRPRLLDYSAHIGRKRQAVTLKWRFALGPEEHPNYHLTARYRLKPNTGRVERSARLERLNSDSTASSRFQGFQFTVPRIAPSSPGRSVVNVPGPWWPDNYVAPNTPYTKLLNRSLDFHSAPDAGFGIMAITNQQQNVTLASWMDTAGGETHYQPSLHGDNERLTMRFHNFRHYRLPPGTGAPSDVHRIELVSGDVYAALDRYRNMVEENMPLGPAPEWVRGATILEVLPRYFDDGFDGLRRKLDFYKKVGFNTLYLMPHWEGGYSPIDPYAVPEELGGEKALARLVRRAHELDMRVLFDMVIHGFDESSPYVDRRPDLFVRDDSGNVVKHRTWGSMTTDWAAPAYQRFMREWAHRHVTRYNIDGYRVDAASYKGPSWNSRTPRPAYRAGTAAPDVMRGIYDELRTENEEAVLLNEVFGPVFSSVSNFSHDNQTEGPQYFLERVAKGTATATDYKAHMAQVFAMLPQGANRVFYTRNHDTSWFYHFNGYTDRYFALEAIHTLCAIPEVFAGDPDNPPNPDDDPAIYNYYEELFSARQDEDAFRQGALKLRQVQTDSEDVFTALRTLGDRHVLVLISLSDSTEKATVHLTSDVPAPDSALTFKDPIGNRTVEPDRGSGSEPRTQTVTLDPYQVLIGGWNAAPTTD